MEERIGRRTKGKQERKKGKLGKQRKGGRIYSEYGCRGRKEKVRKREIDK